MEQREDWKDFLVKDGGEVKALEGGRVGGYLVTFSDENSPDVSGDFFTKETDFGTHRETPTLYHHGLDVKLGDRVIGQGRLLIDEIGVWIEAQLELRDKYEKAIHKLAKLGKLGWSSGTAPHLVKREQKGNAQRILSWPLGLDASLTPAPAEPRNIAMSMKSVSPSDIETETEPEAAGDAAAQSQNQSATETEGTKKMEDEKKEVKAEPTELERIVQKAVDAQKQEAAAQAEKDAREAKLIESIKSIVTTEMKNAPAKEAGGRLNLKTGIGDDEKKAFWYWMRTGDKGAYKTTAYENEAVEDEGGALVPHGFSEKIVEKRDIGSVVRQAGAQIINTSLKIVDIPVEQTRFEAGAVTAESQTATATSYDQNESATPFDLLPVTVRKYTKLYRMSEELLNDQKADLEGYIARAVGRAFGLMENTLFLQGTNSGQPMGAMYSSTKGKDAAAASAIAAGDVMGLYYSLTSPYREGASWVMRGSTESAIRSLQGNVWSFAQTPQGMAGSTGLNTLVGANRVFNTDEIVALATSTKSVLFGNFDFYTIVQNQGLTIRRLNERFADTGQIGFLVSERIGGVITQAEAFMHLLNPSA